MKLVLLFYFNDMDVKLLLDFGAEFQTKSVISDVKLKYYYGNFSYSINTINENKKKRLPMGIICHL